jgi:hypothetical protein
MTKPKLQGLKIMRPMFVIAFFLAVLLPEAAWANYGPPPVASSAPKTLILLLPLVILFTELGGGYKIFKAKTSKYLERWEKAKPLLALFGICFPVFLQSTQVIVLVFLGFTVFCGIRALQLIYFGLFKLIARTQPQWSSQVKAGRLILAGLMILGTLSVLMMASNDAVIAGHHGRRAYDSDAKSNLHNIFLACKAYWADKGASNNCNLDVASGTSYGYLQSSGVVVLGDGGNAKEFEVMAKNVNGKNAFKINHLGKITRKENRPGEDWKENPIQTTSVFSKAYNLLVQFLTE